MIMRISRVTDVSRIRVKYKPIAYCQGTDSDERCPLNFTTGNQLFSTLTPSQVRAQARGHAFDHPGHRVYVDVIDRESFTYTPDDVVNRETSRVSRSD